MNEIYNDSDKQHFNLINDLKNLPKVDAPENFEFNLMTRIENKNFNLAEDESPKFNFIKFLAPSAAVVTAVILFFIFYPKNDQLNNAQLNQSKPPLSQSIANNNPTVTINVGKKNSSQHEKAIANQNQIAVENFQDQSLENQAQAENSVVRLSRNPNSVSVDRYISGDNFIQSDLSRGNVVNSGDQPVENDGFFFKQKTDPQTLKRYREIVDSLKKAQLKLDSLKKASKIP